MTASQHIRSSVSRWVRSGALDGPTQRLAACSALAQELHINMRQASRLLPALNAKFK